MGGLLEYGVNDSTRLTIFTLIGLFILSTLAFLYWDMYSLVESSALTFHSSWASLEFLILWRFTCFLAGASAVFQMFKSGRGVMIVILHDERKETTLHPKGMGKFVTFSSWTLLLNIFYFFIAGILSLNVMNGNQTPSWLNGMLVVVFSAALGASLLTATVVRYIILPGEVRIKRNHDQMFNFPNQMMHNFAAAIFLIFEIILVQPEAVSFFRFLWFGSWNFICTLCVCLCVLWWWILHLLLYRSEITLWSLVVNWNSGGHCFVLSWSMVRYSTHGVQFFDWRNSAHHLAFIDYTISYEFNRANRQINSKRVNSR